MGKIEIYVDNLFKGYKKDKEVLELKEEVLGNLIDKYNDLIDDGKVEEEAFKLAIETIPSINNILDKNKRKIIDIKSTMIILITIIVALGVNAFVVPKIYISLQSINTYEEHNIEDLQVYKNTNIEDIKSIDKIYKDIPKSIEGKWTIKNSNRMILEFQESEITENILYNATILLGLIPEVTCIEYKFNEYSYRVYRSDLEKWYNIDDVSQLIEKQTWDEVVKNSLNDFEYSEKFFNQIVVK